MLLPSSQRLVPIGPTPSHVDVVRHISQEARVVLTSLRGGPPHIARGDLSQDLMDLRKRIEREMEQSIVIPHNSTPPLLMEHDGEVLAASSNILTEPSETLQIQFHDPGSTPSNDDNKVISNTHDPQTHAVEGYYNEDKDDSKHYLKSQQSNLALPPNVPSNFVDHQMNSYARPFLQVIMDPRASGPHTLVTLRAVYRLVDQGSFRFFNVSSEELTKSIMACKFEQTDAGADEAVEMAIADVLRLLVQQDYGVVYADDQQRKDIGNNQKNTRDNENMQKLNKRMNTFALLDAFNTVYTTRQTFVLSPAMCYHFEDVLTSMVDSVFRYHHSSLRHLNAARLILQFLVNQLLQTPLVGGGDGLDETTREARRVHDDTRTVCLRLMKCALRVGWQNDCEALTSGTNSESLQKHNLPAPIDRTLDEEERSLIQIIQDDVCLSLLMTGQAIWAYHDTTTNIPPCFVSLEVLSEICTTLSILWTTVSLRSQLIPQFETILTGFYTRALVLLRKRKHPTNSISFNANLIFDAEVEIILESLVDLLCLHDQGRTIANGNGGSLETMFANYDCHMRRSDVASGLLVELCRCCGGMVNEEGDANLTPTRSLSQTLDQNSETDSMNGDNDSSIGVGSSDNLSSMVRVEHPCRQVPAHLKELCAQAIMGGMKCLFRDDQPSPETLIARSKRRKSILSRPVDSGCSLDDADSQDEDDPSETHVLRYLKARKRLMRKAARVFNKHASRGIEFLVDSGLVNDPVTPGAVAAFLRNGIVVGLDKKQIGVYLGEAGKSPVAGKSPPSWERDWFHKDVLKIYCSLFRFEHQSLLDGLRMFLATFRLPGEAQQIDRILQAFADSCGQVCEESSAGLNLFSDDPKRASDAAYLLSFSIIMLNTDRHNKNIREDRKMNCEAFIKNNTDYGRDITEKGKEFPPEYLAGIYDSINEEEIRTEGEGADGAMTVERWKDVLRGSTEEETENDKPPSMSDAEDLTELVLEHVWKPIMSAIGALWGATVIRSSHSPEVSGGRNFGGSSHSGMLGVQGARLGMDLSIEMLGGVRKLGRIDIFRKIFTWVCEYTGLDDYNTNCIERGTRLTNSIESQSAVVVALRTSLEASDDLDEDCWRRVWSILFELRDLKLICRGRKGNAHSLLVESEADFLKEAARIDWNICLMKGDMNYTTRTSLEQNKGRKVVSVLGAFGRALFGSGENVYEDGSRNSEEEDLVEKSIHGKEDLVLWNEPALSDDEDDVQDDITSDNLVAPSGTSIGDLFESRLIRENLAMSRQMEMPVTGLERVDETRRYHISPRSQVRERLHYCLNLSAIVSDSRFMDENSFHFLVKSLVTMVSCSVKHYRKEIPPPPPSAGNRVIRGMSFDSASTTSFNAPSWNVPVSPASEAFAEVLICELALKNKDRLKTLWEDMLQDHYLSRLTSILVNPEDLLGNNRVLPDPGLEKRITGLLRLSIHAIQHADLANDVLSSWKYLLPMNDEQHASSPLRVLDRHIGEGLWRMVSHVDGLSHLNDDGWEGVVSIMCWCAKRAGSLKPLPVGAPTGLAEDDPALQCYRSLYLLLNTPELDRKIPCSIVTSLRSLVAAGGRRRYPQLSIACLDLLSMLHEKKITLGGNDGEADEMAIALFWKTCWRKIIEGIAEAAELSTDTVSADETFSYFPEISVLNIYTYCHHRILGNMLSLFLQTFS
jgi:Sec7 domain